MQRKNATVALAVLLTAGLVAPSLAQINSHHTGRAAADRARAKLHGPSYAAPRAPDYYDNGAAIDAGGGGLSASMGAMGH